MTKHSTTETRISSRGWSAVVDSVGCTLRSVEHAGRPLLSAPDERDSSAGHHGAVLAPWPGRVVEARYTFGGLERQLSVDEPGFGHALHGFAFDVPWRIVSVDDAHVTHEVVIGQRPGYPWTVRLRIAYRIEDSGVRCESEWTNVGAAPAPFGLGFHPYLKLTDAVIDECVLELRARVSCDSDPTTKRPLPARATTTDADFVAPRRIGGERFSRAYGGLRRDDGIATAKITAPDGFTVELGVDEGFPWLQVFTGDLPRADLARAGIAIEPQTCPPDAFNTGDDLQTLAPGETRRATWFLRATPAGTAPPPGSRTGRRRPARRGSGIR